MNDEREKTLRHQVEVITSGSFARGPGQKQVDEVMKKRTEKLPKVTRFLAEQRRGFGLLKRTALFLTFDNLAERED